MRKIFFYLFILKKVFLLLLYPLLDKKGEIYSIIRKNIENYLIFQPSRLRARRIKRNLLKKINPQRFLNQEGIKLYGWFIKPKNKKPVFLHFHGQAESILSHQDIAEFCIERGYGLFLLSYRGHYKSGGKASEQGIYNDAVAAIKQLKKLGVDQDKIILWGHSLGSCVAVETAVNGEFSAMIIQSPIKDIKSAALGVFEFYCNRLHLPFFAKLAKKHIEKMDFIQKMDNLGKIGKIDCPILIMHSVSDRIAPYTNSVELAEENKKSKLFLSECGSHWDALWCFEEIDKFTEEVMYSKALK